jgi:hypothetical protein
MLLASLPSESCRQFDGKIGGTRSVGDQIWHVASMTLGAVVMTMRLAGGVEMAFGAARIGGAAVTHLVHMEAMLARGQAADAYINEKPVTARGEGDHPGHAAARAGFERGTGNPVGRGRRGR